MKLKTTVLAMTIAIAGAFSISASAQCDKKECPKGDRTEMTGDKMYRPQSFTDFAFEGVLLSVDQQGKVDAINAEYKAKREACRKGDRCERAELCKEYVGKMKEVLEPAQYVTFLENIVFMPRPEKPMGHHKMDCKQMKDCKDMPKCKKDECVKDNCKKDCKGDVKKDCKKDCKKADCKKDCKKADCKKDCKKADCKKDCKKGDCKKDCKKQ